MNTSQFMDKQIMDLSNSQSNNGGNSGNDFIDLLNPPEDHHISGGTVKKDDIIPSYEFHPIRPIGVSSPRSNIDSTNVSGARAWSSADSKTNTPSIRNYGSVESIEPTTVVLEKDRNIVDATLISEIDRTMKKHADALLHALEGVSARLSQLETRTRHLEGSLDDLKVSLGTNHGNTDGKLRQLENILREVQTNVQVVRDKQEIVDAQLQLAKLQVPNAEQPTETCNIVHTDSAQPTASIPQQVHQHLLPSLPPPNAPPPPPSQQNLQGQFPNQNSQNQVSSVPQRESYFPQPVQTPESAVLQYQIPPPPQQLQPAPPTPPPPQQYQPPPQSQYSQPPPPLPPQSLPPPPLLPQSHPLPPPLPQSHLSLSSMDPSQPPSPLGHHQEETPYSQTYPPSIRPTHSASGPPSSQQFYGAPPNIYEPPSSRPSPGFSGTYGASSGHGETYPYSSGPSQYGSGSPMKSQQLPPSAVSQSGGSSYPQLPTARILPHALPTASGVGSGSAGTGNRVPIDDVVDKVTNMGFPRDQVRATVRKLTENGQSVDLNVVLDKLMNDSDGQGPRGWFGR